MKPRRLESETMVSRLATDGPGSSAGVVGLCGGHCGLLGHLRSERRCICGGREGRMSERSNDRPLGPPFSHERSGPGRRQASGARPAVPDAPDSRVAIGRRDSVGSPRAAAAGRTGVELATWMTARQTRSFPTRTALEPQAVGGASPPAAAASRRHRWASSSAWRWAMACPRNRARPTCAHRLQPRLRPHPGRRRPNPA